MYAPKKVSVVNTPLSLEQQNDVVCWNVTEDDIIAQFASQNGKVYTGCKCNA